MMQSSDWLGVLLGAVIGSVYALLQWWDWRRKEQSQGQGKMLSLLPGAALRLTFAVVALVLAVSLTDANKFWLAGTFAVFYSLPLFWKLKQVSKQK